MSLNTICIVGAPGTGKTTLVKSVLPLLGEPGEVLTHRATEDGRMLNPVTVTFYPHTKVLVMGIYDDSPYGGTDRFGLNVAPVATHMLEKLEGYAASGCVLLFEGDRLTSKAFLEECETYGPVNLLYLEVPEEVLEARRADRARNADGDWLKTASKMFHGKPRRADRDQGQDATWLKGRLTKINSVVSQFPTTRIPHVSWDHHRLARRILLSKLGIVEVKR